MTLFLILKSFYNFRYSACSYVPCLPAWIQNKSSIWKMNKKTASQLGFWTSVFIAAGGGIYCLILIYSFATDGFANPISPFVQLTVIQQNLPEVPADLVRFLPYSQGSVMFALEILGWGFFSSLAAAFVALLFSSTPLNITIRWSFILYAVFSFMSVISFATNTLIPTGPVAWGWTAWWCS